MATDKLSGGVNFASKVGGSAFKAGSLAAAGPGLIAGGIATIGLSILGGILGKDKNMYAVRDKDLANYLATGSLAPPERKFSSGVEATLDRQYIGLRNFARTNPTALTAAFETARKQTAGRSIEQLAQSSGTTFVKETSGELIYRNPIGSFLPRSGQPISDPFAAAPKMRSTNTAKQQRYIERGYKGPFENNKAPQWLQQQSKEVQDYVLGRTSGGSSASKTTSGPSSIPEPIKIQTEPVVRTSQQVIDRESKRKRQILNQFTRASTIRAGTSFGTDTPILATAGILG